MFIPNKTPFAEFLFWRDSCEDLPALASQGAFIKRFGRMKSGELQEVKEWASATTGVTIEVSTEDEGGVCVSVAPIQTVSGRTGRRQRKKIRRAANRFRQAIGSPSPLVVVKGEVIRPTEFCDVVEHHKELRRAMD